MLVSKTQGITFTAEIQNLFILVLTKRAKEVTTICAESSFHWYARRVIKVSFQKY